VPGTANTPWQQVQLPAPSAWRTDHHTTNTLHINNNIDIAAAATCRRHLECLSVLLHPSLPCQLLLLLLLLLLLHCCLQLLQRHHHLTHGGPPPPLSFSAGHRQHGQRHRHAQQPLGSFIQHRSQLPQARQLLQPQQALLLLLLRCGRRLLLLLLLLSTTLTSSNSSYFSLTRSWTPPGQGRP